METRKIYRTAGSSVCVCVCVCVFSMPCVGTLHGSILSTSIIDSIIPLLEFLKQLTITLQLQSLWTSTLFSFGCNKHGFKYRIIFLIAKTEEGRCGIRRKFHSEYMWLLWVISLHWLAHSNSFYSMPVNLLTGQPNLRPL